MKINLRSLEEYDKLSDEQLKGEIIMYQGMIENIPREIDDDTDLQKAIRIVSTLKEKHSSKKKQCKSVLETLNLLARSRGLL